MASLPIGTVTFLFTDIDGSTRLLQQLGDRYAEVLATHRWLLRTAILDAHGHEIGAEGDALSAAFPRARDALLAAVAAQRVVQTHPWPQGISPRVRMGLHTGEPLSGETGYVGMDVHKAARITAAGHGGQILISQTTRELVVDELPDGVGLRDLGEHRLKDLDKPHRLFQVIVADLLADFPPLRSLNIQPHNLPIQLTSFIGRTREIAEIKRLLGPARLVTLTGSGGAGKTRLALQVGAEVVDVYPDGVWLAELAPIADLVLVPKTVASALSVPEQPGCEMTETLVDALRPKALLLVLDNCEHLLMASADLAAALLRACPQVHILATSREELGVAGEAVWRVPSLSLPNLRRLPVTGDLVQYEAIRLFVERATLIQPGFAVTDSNAVAIAQVCTRLDGIPLAIELAAARVKVLPVEEIAKRLGDQFGLLTGGSRTAPPRQQTLQAAMDWSYDLLSEKERTMLRRLSIFAGGWTLETAEAVCAEEGIEASDILDLLTRLLDKSLVVKQDRDGEGRFRLLETIKQYARGRLLESGEAESLDRRHRDHYLALAERADQELRGPGQHIWLARLEAEHDNLRAALDWSQATEEGVEAGLRLAAALHRYWLRRGHWSEGRQRLTAVLSHGAAQQSSLAGAKALHAAGQMASIQDHDPEAWMYCKKALAVYQQLQDKVGIAVALYSLGMLAHKQDDQATARSNFEKSLAMFRESGDKSGIATVLNDLAEVAAMQGDNVAAQLMLEESLAIRRELGDVWGMGAALNDLGGLARLRGDYQQAAALYHKSLTLHLESGSKADIAWLHYNLGVALLHMGDHQQAAALFRESLTGYLELESKSGISQSIAGLASVTIAKGQPQRGVRLLSISKRLLELSGQTLDLVDRLEFDRNVAAVRALLNEEVFRVVWAEGRAMTLEQAIEYTLKVPDGDTERNSA